MESTALELVNKLDGAVDLLVSDIKMPVMDGITLAWSVRSEFPSFPVDSRYSGSGYADVAQTKLPNSGFEFVQIPFHPATLLSAVKKVMWPDEEHSFLGRDRNGTMNVLTRIDRWNRLNRAN